MRLGVGRRKKYFYDLAQLHAPSQRNLATFAALERDPTFPFHLDDVGNRGKSLLQQKTRQQNYYLPAIRWTSRTRNPSLRWTAKTMAERVHFAIQIVSESSRIWRERVVVVPHVETAGTTDRSSAVTPAEDLHPVLPSNFTAEDPVPSNFMGLLGCDEDAVPSNFMGLHIGGLPADVITGLLLERQRVAAWEERRQKRQREQVCMQI